MRFSILCRVSTETQEKGVSLDVQEKTLLKCVEFLKGVVTKKYIGQEHSTEGFERPILDQLLIDAKNKEFDALIIYDFSRLTRDPVRSKAIQAKLNEYNIKLYVQLQEFSFNNPESSLIFALMSEVNAFQTRIMVQKSIESKIELALKGFPMFGHVPYGRFLESSDHSKNAVWLVEPICLKKANEVYDLFINQGVTVDKISRILNISKHLINVILKDKPIHKQSVNFKGEKLLFETKIPTILTEQQLIIARDKLKKNKRSNGKVYDYLLSGLVRCEHCGLTAVGMKQKERKKIGGYYAFRGKHKDDCAKHVPAIKLERIVLDSIIEVVGKNDILMKCIKESNALSGDRKKELEEQYDKVKANLTTYENKKEKLVKSIADGLLDDDDVKILMPEIKATILECQRLLTSIETELDSLASLDFPDVVIKKINYIFSCFCEKLGFNVSDWPFKVQRELVEWFFGTDKNNGVYVSKDGKKYQYTLKSNLGTLSFGAFNTDDDDGYSYGITRDGSPMTAEKLATFRSILQQDLYTRTELRVHQATFAYTNVKIIIYGSFQVVRPRQAHSETTKDKLRKRGKENSMFKKVTVFDIETKKYLVMSVEEYKKNKGRYFNVNSKITKTFKVF